MPLISVILPVFNAARYLRAAVESTLAQTTREIEIIAVDDGSCDDSFAILQQTARLDSRIHVLTRPNTGIVGALNDGLALARGDWVARMDGDDWAHPSRFEKQLCYLQVHPECVAVGTHAWIMDKRGASVDRFTPPTDHEGIMAQLLRGNGAALLHPSVMFKRSALEAAGGYDPKFCKAEDLDLYFRLGQLGRFANLPETLMRYRLHPASTNFSHRERQRALVSFLVTRERNRKGLPPLEDSGPLGPADMTPVDLHRLWACTSCDHGTYSTALRHSLLALMMDPLSLSTWRTLRYTTGRLQRRTMAKA